jgi:putative mRNA 3-end processing factor
MTEITFLGGADEVGRMGVIIDSGRERFLLDYGVNVENMDVPLQPKMPITALLLSHAHLDHSGNIPALYKGGWNGSVYATPTTFELCSLLLRDSLKVQKKKGLIPKYLMHDLAKMERMKKSVAFRKVINFKSASVKFYDAGHVPGSASILLETNGKRILYTGDIKFVSTELLKAADTGFDDIDIVICESTYSYKNHPDRKRLTDSLREKIQHTIYNNGIAVLPCFAVGRTQEMLSVVSNLGFPIFLDGMGIEATRRVLSHPESVRDYKKLRKAFKKARKIRRGAQRKNVIANPCIIITTAGMLSGGPVGFYIKKLHERGNCLLALSGFQVPGTVGRRLLDTGRYVHEGLDVKPKMKVEFMDLSAHCGRDGIINFLKKASPEKTFLVHGERTEEFAGELKGMGFDAHAPKNGEKIRV